MGIRRLSNQEQVEWVSLAKDTASKLTGATEQQLLAEMERRRCEVEMKEVEMLTIEMLLRGLGNDDFHNPLPTRKACEAMRLAFPDFSPNVASLGG